MKVQSIKSISSYRMISSDDLRMVCIKNDYYTRGDCEAYSHLLSKVASQYVDFDSEDDRLHSGIKIPELTDDLLQELVIDIFNHSDVDNMISTYGCNYDEILESIASNIVDASWTSFEIKGTYEEE